VTLANHCAIPAIDEDREFVDVGGLMSYEFLSSNQRLPRPSISCSPWQCLSKSLQFEHVILQCMSPFMALLGPRKMSDLSPAKADIDQLALRNRTGWRRGYMSPHQGKFIAYFRAASAASS